MLSSEFGRRCQVRSRARRWLQLVGCAALLMDASNFGGPDGVGESRVCYERLTLWTPIKFFPIAAGRMTTLYPIPTLNPYLYYS